jgi:hypothetical protein
LRSRRTVPAITDLTTTAPASTLAPASTTESWMRALGDTAAPGSTIANVDFQSSAQGSVAVARIGWCNARNAAM